MKRLIIRPDFDDIEVDVRFGDRLRAEREMSARGWGSPQSNPLTWLTLATWRACLREKADVPQDFDEFTDQIAKFQEVDGGDVDPFPEAPTTGN